VRHWLSSLNLPEQYEALLLKAGYDTLTKCKVLNDVLLEQIGIKPMGHRRRILLHLPRAETEAELLTSAAHDSEEDDREIYDIPPVCRRSGIMLTHESTYTNIAEMNELPRPILPPKKRLSSDVEVDAKLGILGPPVKPRQSQSVFGTSSSFPDSGRTMPKLCVVYPEKRPPVPARRISKEGKVLSMTAENPLNNNDKGFESGFVEKPPAVCPVVMPRPLLKHQGTISEEDGKSDAVPIADRQFSEPCATVVTSVGPFHRAESVDVASKPRDAGRDDAILQANRLNPGLEHELQEIVSTAKKSVLRKIDPNSETADSSCSNGTDVSVQSAVVQPNNTIPVCVMPSNLGNHDRTVSVEDCSISAVTSLEANDLYNLETSAEQTNSGNVSHLHNEGGLDCVYVDTDEVANADSQELNVKDLEPGEKDELSDDVVYENLDRPAVVEQDYESSSECQYAPPSFPPPPLPADFEPYGVFELSMFAECGADKWEPCPRTSTRTISPFAEARATQSDCVKPQPPPRRRQSTTADVVDDAALSPLVAGFSSALDEYLTKKATSPTSWLDQHPGPLSMVRNVSDSDFEPFADFQLQESLSETANEISSTNQSVVPLASDGDCLIPSDDNIVVYEFEASTDDSSKTKSFHDNAPGIVKPLNIDDFKEVTCTIGTGN